MNVSDRLLSLQTWRATTYSYISSDALRHRPGAVGLITVVNLVLGICTPPFCVDPFAACTLAKISLDKIVANLIPFVLVILACLMVATYAPQLSLFLSDPVYVK